MKIFFTIKLTSYWKDKYKKLKHEFPEVEFINNTEPSEKLSILKECDALVTGRMTEEEINSASKLKTVFVPFTGLNGFPMSQLHDKNIMVTNTHANTIPVAEHAVTLALSLLHRIVEFHNDLTQGEWHWNMETDYWTSLYGMPCTILGYGSIGCKIAEMLSAFNCPVYAYKRNIEDTQDKFALEISSDIEYVIEKGSMIFIALPLTDETKNIISREVIKKMNGKYIINIGRGGLIDEDALYEALTDGTIKGAGLDVWYKYPPKETRTGLPASRPFHELKNVVMTPHKAGHTIESIQGMIDDTYRNIRSFILNGKPDILVPKGQLY